MYVMCRATTALRFSTFDEQPLVRRVIRPHRSVNPTYDAPQMRLDTDVFDLWVFCRASPEPRYLLLHTSQEKAEKWFGGGRFWQIPSGFAEPDQAPPEYLLRHLVGLDLTPLTLWAVEHVYTIYNRRYNALQVIPVFAAEIAAPTVVTLDWEHSEYRWATASECSELLTFRGLRDGLRWLREYITEASPAPEFLLDRPAS